MISDALPVLIGYVDSGQRLRFCNALFETWFQQSRADLLGRSLQEISSPAQYAQLRPEIEAALSGQRESYVDTVLYPDGVTRCVRRNYIPRHSKDGRVQGYCFLIEDITETKRVERALSASEAKLAGILDISPEAVISVDRSHCITLFNQGAEALFGYSTEEMLGQPLDALMPPRFRTAHRRHVEGFGDVAEVSRLMSRRGEVCGLRKDGTEFPAEASISQLEIDGEKIFTVMLRDVTERKLAEAALLAGKKDAELANRAKSEFLANMSHELRTPLNAIIGFAEIIQDERLGPLGTAQYGDYAKEILDAGRHLLTLIVDILDLSKIEAGRAELRDDTVDVLDVIRFSIRMLAARAKEGHVALEQEVPEGTPALRADERMLKQILINLLSNAVKFTPEGGSVLVKTWFDPAEGYAFQISDTGIGMAVEDIPKALSRFVQIEGRLDRRYEGTGLGLSLSKSLVELHGGTLELSSEIGVGTTVTVRLPALRAVHSAGKARAVRMTGAAAS